MASFKILVHHVSAITQVFDDAVTAFNNQDQSKTLSGMLDVNVALFTVNKQIGYVGIPNVMGYLNAKQFPLKSTFTPTTVQVTESQNGKVAHILGTADWKDDDGDKDGPIRYAFNFVYKTVNGKSNWLISTLWGSSDQ